MSTGAIILMAGSWTFILGLTIWCFAKMMMQKEHFDPDGDGPATPPKKGLAEK